MTAWPAGIDPGRHKLVFVGGLHRSGTSLVARLIAAHPEASGLTGTGVFEDEGQKLQDVYAPASAFGGAGRFAFSESMHMTERDAGDEDERREKAARLLAAWAPYWDTERPVLVEKSPPNLLKTRYLQALFPNARFVLVERHPVAVAVATSKWSRSSRYSLVSHWVRAHERAAGDLPHLGAAMTLRYEDLVAAPERWYGALTAFLGLGQQSPPLPVRGGVNEKYYAKWESGNLLERRSAKRAASEFEKRVAAFGYSLKPPYLLSVAESQDSGQAELAN
jgi:hypothetical protein